MLLEVQIYFQDRILKGAIISFATHHRDIMHDEGVAETYLHSMTVKIYQYIDATLLPKERT